MAESPGVAAPHAEMPAIDPSPASSPSRLSLLRRAVAFLAILAALVAAWELYKVTWRGLGWSTPVRPSNDSMPHTWDIVDALFSPARRGGDDILLVLLLRAAWFTLREALVGFLIGGVVGLALALVFARSPLVERGFMPFVIASQTIPLIAIAPMIVIWGSQRDLPRWLMVSVIAAYLTFFPVVINTLRGLRSPPATSVELMRSYAAKPRQVLWKLQLPAAVPYMFTAFRIAATASVIGAIIGELPSGLGDGLGRALLNFMYYYISGPEKLYAAIIISAFVGIAFVGTVVLVERLVVPPTRRVES